MRLTIDQPELAAVLAPTGLCSTNPPVPIAAAALLEADQRLTIRACDEDQWATATVSADIMEPGQVAVSGRLLREVVKVIPKTAQVHLEAADVLAVTTTTPRGSWSLPVLDHTLFPPIPAVDGKLGTVDAAALATALGRVVPFVGTDASLPTFCAVCVHAGQRLLLAATDRYRLAVAELDWDPVGEAELYVPATTAKAWLELAKAAPATLTLLAGGGAPTSLAALADDTMVTTTRLHAEYPPWQSLDTPADQYPTTVLVDVAEVHRALAGTLAVAEPAHRGVREAVLLTIDPTELRLASRGRGATTQHAPVRAFDGTPVRVGIDPSKLAAALACLGAPQAVLSLHDQAMRQILLRPAADGAVLPGYRHALMPMRAPEGLAT